MNIILNIFKLVNSCITKYLSKKKSFKNEKKIKKNYLMIKKYSIQNLHLLR